jgi:hypothetical protein
MIGNFLQITPAQLAEAIEDPSMMDRLLDPEEDSQNAIDVDKAWHAIHYLLTQSAWDGNPPLANAVLGGTAIGDDLGYGPAKYITAPQVKDVAAKLPNRESLKSAFDANALTSEEIYPEIWDEGEDALDYVLEHYESMMDYYLDAASRGNAMLKFLN